MRRPWSGSSTSWPARPPDRHRELADWSTEHLFGYSGCVAGTPATRATTGYTTGRTAFGRPAITTLAGAVPARDRTIPVDEPLGSLLPDGGLQRGRVVGCDGPAAVSVAGALVAGAARAGSWVLLLGAATVGLEALAELGVPLHRVVAVETDTGPAAWAERLAAAADGFELILTVPPRGAERVERKVRQRLQARGAVLIAITTISAAGPTRGAVGRDLSLTTVAPRWVGIGSGHGRLVAREVDVVVAGRRMPRAVHRTLWLPGPDGRVDVASTVASPVASPVASTVASPVASVPDRLERVG